MRIVQTAARFASVVEIENLRTGARRLPRAAWWRSTVWTHASGDTIRVTARGPDAADALRALESLHAGQFGDLPENGPRA